MEPDFYVIAGPTGSGKTAFSLQLDPDLYEIIGCDSRQVYREMEVGTAAPSAYERSLIPHHCISWLSPEKEINAALYVEKADEAILAIRSRERTPVIVGGTGFYLRALATHMTEAPSSPELRGELQQMGLEEKRELLKTKDPDAMQPYPDRFLPGKIHPNDEYRIDRALEAILISGKKWSENWQISRSAEKKRYHFRGIRLEPEGEEYRHGLEIRVQKMLEKGFIEEAVLIRNRYGENCPGLRSLGYSQALEAADGLMDHDELVRNLVRLHYQYGRKQLTWFRREENLTPLDPNKLAPTSGRIEEWLSSGL